MESAGSAVVDFGRFCTGFLVVMGVGMCHISAKFAGSTTLGRHLCRTIYADMCLYSSSGIIGPLWPDRCPGYGHVNSRRTANLRNHHKLHDVFPGGAGFLEPISTCIIKERALL